MQNTTYGMPLFVSLLTLAKGNRRIFSYLNREGNGTPLQYSCLEKSHGWRSLVGCSPWSHQQSDMTERLHFHFSLSCIGEGNGNPIQCSCLENPRDGGAWRAAVYGVPQSRTRLRRLSSSSSKGSEGLPRWLSGKEPTCQCRKCRFNPWVGKISLEQKMATHSSILAWEIPRKISDEPGRLQSMGSHKSWRRLSH